MTAIDTLPAVLTDALKCPLGRGYQMGADALHRAGYSVLPIMPGTKKPGYVRNDHEHDYKWQERQARLPSADEVQFYADDSCFAELAIALGPVSGGVIALDFDYEPADGVFEAIKSVLPPAVCGKRGAKGFTLFFQSPELVNKKRWMNPVTKTVIVELLTQGQYTIVPPSTHPTGTPFVWHVEGRSLDQFPSGEGLPLLTQAHLDAITAKLTDLGYGQPEREAPATDAGAFSAEGNDWQTANSAALANLDAWVYDLPWTVPPKRSGKWLKCVPFWRPNHEGVPDHQRVPSLSICADAIADNGNTAVKDGYSPVDLVSHALGITIDKALTWLQDKLGLEREKEGFSPQEIASVNDKAAERAREAEERAKEAAERTKEESAPPATPADSKPDDPYAGLYNVPGALGDITRYICDTALQPIPLHALGAALVVIGTAAGRRYRGPTQSSCVLYVANIAESGTGKEHPMEAAKVILREAGLGAHVGPGEFASGEAFLKTVTMQPLGLSAVDEFGSVWSDMNNQRMPWMGKIARYMRTQWGKNFGSLETTAKAQDSSVTILAPHYSIIGASTPKQFWHSLRGSNVEDGTLNRMLVLTAEPGKPDPSHKPRDRAVPERIVTLLKAIYGGQMFPTRNDRESLGEVIDIPFGEGAEDYWTKMRDGFATKADNPTVGLFFRRAAEMSLRVAQIRAIGINQLQPVINVADLEWGAWVVGLSTKAMANNGVDFIADSEHQANLKEVRRIIRKAGDTITRIKLVRALDGAMKARDLDDAVRLLIDGGEVAETTLPPGDKGGRPGKVYMLAPTA